MSEAVLEIENLAKHFPIRSGIFGGERALVRAVDNVSFSIPKGQTLGLVGESGCGKSTTAKLILKLEDPTDGVIRVNGKELLWLNKSRLLDYRRSVQAVFQDPYASLNPRMRVEAIVSEPLTTHEKLSKKQVRERVEELLELVGLPARAARLFPHEFSGGQRQRIAIARALSLNPELIVLDESVSALDVSIRAQILNLFQDLQKKLGVSYLFISHDLAAVAYMSHRIAVMYLGRIVEIGDTETIINDPKHPYTQALFAASLPDSPEEEKEAPAVRGEVPNPISPPPGCHFHPRCPHAMEKCKQAHPVLEEVSGRQVACYLYD